MRSSYFVFAIGAKRFCFEVEIDPTFSAFRCSACQNNNMADNMMSEENVRFTSNMKELLARLQQQKQELNAPDEEPITELFSDIQQQQQMENASQSTPNTAIEQGG